MKATIFYWAFQKFEEITGFVDREEIPYDRVFEIAQEIFNKGLNVMIYHKSIEGDIILFVDDERFT
jgi:hypothetical protein